MTKKIKRPWPTKDAMTQIYDMNLWGGKTSDFYSGSGSHDPKIITPYINSIISFLESHNNALTICDLGCGDFNIGKRLIKYSKKYIAVDVVEGLINRNKILYKANHLEFYCLDITKDELPQADCIILRQVLQHLSNKDIKRIVNKLAIYKYIILTEHIPIGSFTPNKDIISGQGIRLKKNSGVDILNYPFNFKIKAKKQLGEYILDNGKGRIETVLFNVF
ncbi:class I SAM-dependent methyltransferase [uncultured Algibacter sp.]|uniref:class I SAM-dependent methyltransferase n=1 Tax=uncultured Algibacter sp. TaxID=298659 RepID=UPI003216B036